MTIYTSIYSTFQLTFHLLYLASFSWQLLLSNTHRAILHSDNVLSTILKDRVKGPHKMPDALVNSLLGDRSEENRYTPSSDNDSNVNDNDSTTRESLSASQQSFKSLQSSQQSSQQSFKSQPSSQQSFKSQQSSQQLSQQSSMSQQSSQQSSQKSTQTVDSATSTKKTNNESKPQNPVKYIVEYIEEEPKDKLINELYRKKAKRDKPKNKPRDSKTVLDPVVKTEKKDMFKPTAKYFWRSR